MIVEMKQDINKNEIQEKIRERIKLLMEKKGFKQKDLVERTGLSQVFLSYFLTGKRKAGIDTLEKIAQALGVSVAELLEEHDERKPPELERIARRVKFLPVVAAVKAGPPGEPAQFRYTEKTYPYIGELPCKENECFVIEVDGDSMEPTLKEGDYVLVKRIDAYEMRIPENFINKIVVAANEDWEYTIKRLKKIDKQYFLSPDNPKYDIQKPNGWHIIGVAIERLPKPEKL